MNRHRWFVASAAIRAGAAMLALASQVMLVRLLGADAYGGYVVFVTTSALVAVVATGGLDITTMRRVSIGHDRGDREVIVAGIRRACLLILVMAVLSCALFVALRSIPALERWQQFTTVGGLALFFGVTTLALATLGAATVRGLHRFVAADAIDFMARPLAVLGGVAALAVLAPAATALVPAAFVGGNAVAIVLCALTIRRALGDLAGAPEPLAKPSEASIRPSATLMAHALMSYAVFQLDTLLVGSYRGALEAGAYNMASNFVRLVIFVPLILAAHMQPQAAVLFARKDYDALIALVQNRLWKSMLAAGIAAAALILSARALLQLVDPQFVSSATALSILSLAHLINSALLVLAGALLAGGQQNLVLRAQLCGLAICVPLYFLLIPDYGASGAAAAVLLGLGVNLGTLVWLLRRHLRIQIAR